MAGPIDLTSPAFEKEVAAMVKGIDAVVKQVDLLDVVLVDIRAKRSSTDDIPAEYTLQEFAQPRVIESQPPGAIFRVVYTFGIRGVKTGENGNDERELFRIESCYQLTYGLKRRKDIRKKDVISFAEANTIIHIWPFWRELVHNHTSRMGLPIVTLGVKPPKASLAEIMDRVKQRHAGTRSDTAASE